MSRHFIDEEIAYPKPKTPMKTAKGYVCWNCQEIFAAEDIEASEDKPITLEIQPGECKECRDKFGEDTK